MNAYNMFVCLFVSSSLLTESYRRQNGKTFTNKTLCDYAEQSLNHVFIFYVGDHIDQHLSLVRV